MAKRKNINRSSNTLGIFVSLVFIAFITIIVMKFISSDDLTLTSSQVWCANCQTYHDKETAEQEAQDTKLVWCINCNKYHAPDADESK
tara:strand:- start:737 stop:1000 length:264 start_codon:yes stop_codon:yes gene_type:complete